MAPQSPRPLRTSDYTAHTLAGERGIAIRRLQQDLLNWYESQRRDLPWRRTRDPYCIWVSEIMLQQTQVATAIGFYERWIKRFPNCSDLAAASMDDVLGAWAGLGYYSRARNLRRAAERVVDNHQGQLPRTVPELRRLPGIGAYSAGAIASIAFAADEPAVDGNIIRVLTRLFCLRGNPRRAPLANGLWDLARGLIPRGRASDFNQALMELGATHCSPKSPTCSACPVRRHCQAHKSDCATQLPELPARRKVQEERRVVAVVNRRGRILSVRAKPNASRWAGLWQFPDTEVAGDHENAASDLEGAVLRDTGIVVEIQQRIGTLQHHVTHFRITVEVFTCRARAGRARSIDYAEVRWCSPTELCQLAMPAAHRKIARTLIAGTALSP